VPVSGSDVTALAYHQATKHDFNRFARSAGYLDWATQPDPFRRYIGAPLVPLSRAPVAADVPYAALFDESAPVRQVCDETVGEFLRCSMGLSAWKEYRGARWALRVNPSSGNLHPTEAYVVRDGAVCHYAPREHALEQRCMLDSDAWRAFSGARDGFLVALTSIHWREAWKYGERAFRYCQHDAGHALAAMRYAAALLGWRLAVLSHWTDDRIAAVLGLDRADDFGDAEREEAEVIAVVTPGDVDVWRDAVPDALVDAARSALWHGRANVLSTGRVEWPMIDRVALATRSHAGARAPRLHVDVPPRAPTPAYAGPDGALARRIILQRRSAVAFDGRSSLPRDSFIRMLARTRPGTVPWDAIDWPPHVHLLIFVHRVDGLTPGVYACLRDAAVLPAWRSAMRPEFLWEPVPEAADALFLLLPMDVTWAANRVSCDQDIASDGFFSLGMLARFEPALRERGDPFYRRLFWETGMIGQVLYLEAEAAGARATGIGCFYDDPVHDVAGLSGAAWQSLYHLAMGMPVEDTRLTTEPGYGWEIRNSEFGIQNLK
jgi:SagB-type dehydrogenase family enzyme